jgi:DNA-directed RNA polymerase subunit M/transcription elongation factor TFIIS
MNFFLFGLDTRFLLFGGRLMKHSKMLQAIETPGIGENARQRKIFQRILVHKLNTKLNAVVSTTTGSNTPGSTTPGSNTPGSTTPGSNAMDLKTASLQLQEAYAGFYKKLPNAPHHQAIAEALLAHVNKLIRSCHNINKPTKIVEGLILYLKTPTWSNHLAAFGNLPRAQYITTADPWKHHYVWLQQQADVKDIEKMAEHERKRQKEKKEQQHKATEAYMTSVFKGERKEGIRCLVCKNLGVEVIPQQNRSSDEGMSTTYKCQHPDHVGSRIYTIRG